MARSPKSETMIESFSIPPSRLRKSISHCIQRKRPLMIWGQPGIGKSDIVADVAQSQGRPLIDIRLPLLEPTDMRGIPYLADVKITGADGVVLQDTKGVDITNKEFRWSPPSDLPTDQMSNALVFFDEISAAPPSVQAATYQIILNRRIGSYKLPDNVVMVAAGNRVRDKGVAYNMPTPLANRFVHVTLEANVDDWKMWALQNQISSDVVGYLNFQPQDLNNFNPSQASFAFATPRTWSFVSDLLQESKDGIDYDPIDDQTLSDLIRGTVGEASGLKFITYRKHTASLPAPRDILNGKVTKIKDPRPDVMYALIVALSYELINTYGKAVMAQKGEDPNAIKKWHLDVDVFLRFIMDNMPPELCVFAVKTLMENGTGVKINGGLLKFWVEFTDRFLQLMPNRSN